MAQDEKVTRKLAAILAADVVGFSRLMEADEAGTIARLRALRQEIVDPGIARDGGRIVKTMGDGLLVEFPSVVDAVRNAVEVQRAVAAHNANVPDGERIEFRVGINLGDIVIDGDDILGDGVNVASRLEALAQPGGICVAGNVQEQVAGKLDLAFDDMGEQQVKNIVKPIRVFRVRLDAPASGAATGQAADRDRPVKPSVAVLPFVNMSGDPEQEYFVDGMVDEIITALARIRWLQVTARTSSFEYKGQAVDIREIARRLNARYVLEGSVRKAGDRVRIIAQLIDGATGDHLWADRFDGELADIFDLQDRITECVVGAIEPSVRLAEIERARRKRPESLDAYDYYLRALAHTNTSTREDSIESLRLIEKALALDPNYVPAIALAAWSYFNLVTHSWSSDPEGDEKKGVALARAVLDAGSDDADSLANAAFVLATLAHDLDAGLTAIERAIALSPNSAHVVAMGSWVMTLAGDQAKALERLQTALRLSPSDPVAYRFLTGAAICNLLLGRYEEAVALGEQGRARYAKWGPTFRTLAAAYAQLGRDDKAAEALARLLELEPAATISNFRRRLPFQNAKQAERLWEGLRKAGLPE